MADAVKIIECPRDAWHGLPVRIPAEVKADYLRVLIAAGFHYIDAVSFVAAGASPQMADSEKVLDYLDPPDDTEILGLVTDAKGAGRAIKTGALQTLVFPYSVSPRFLEKSQGQTPEEALESLEQIGELAYKAGLEVAATITMAFGNPYGEAWSIDEVVDACDLLIDSGVSRVTLADTAALATPKLVADLLSDVRAVHEEIELGVHLYAAHDASAALVRSAYDAGCRTFYTTIGGLGSGVETGDRLVSNLATEAVLEQLTAVGAELPPLRPLDGLLSASAEIARRYGAKVQ